MTDVHWCGTLTCCLCEDGNWVNIDSEESCCFLSPTKGARRDLPLLLYHGESTPTSFDGEVHRLPLRADSEPVPIQDGQSCCVF